MEYYHDIVTQKSFQLLQALRKKYEFILIGGWAVFLFTKSLKSKDIDILVGFSELEKLRQFYSMTKNDRLKKYEIKIEEIDIDIYVHNYSNPGLPAEAIANNVVFQAGFSVPRPEILLILKQAAHQERAGTPKGEKDKIDIISLLTQTEMNFEFYKTILQQYHQGKFVVKLRELVIQTKEIKELNINQHKFSQIKKTILDKL